MRAPTSQFHHPLFRLLLAGALCLGLQACTVIAIADAVVSTTVKVGAAVVGTAVDVTRAGAGVVTGSSRN